MCTCMRNSNKNLKTSLRKRKPLRREQRWAERGKEIGDRGEEGGLGGACLRELRARRDENPNDYDDDDYQWWWRRRRRRRTTTTTRVLCKLYASTRHTSAHPYLATIPGSGARDGKRLIVIVKRAARIPLSPTSYRPDRIHGLCDRSCRRCSKSCHRPRCSCERCGPSCYNCSSFASRSDQSRCHPPGSCAPCDQSCCNCNSSAPVPVERQKHQRVI